MTHDKVRQDFEAAQKMRDDIDLAKKLIGYYIPKAEGEFIIPLLDKAGGYQAGRAAERAEIREKLESEGLVDVVSDVIDDIADRNLARDANGKPILYNAVGITEAAIKKILEVI